MEILTVNEILQQKFPGNLLLLGNFTIYLI